MFFCLSGLWRLFALTAISLAVLVSLLRLALPLLPHYKNEVAHFASVQLGQNVTIGEMSGQWRTLQPSITLRDIKLLSPAGLQQIVAIDQAQIQLDVLQSLLQWQPVAKEIAVTGAVLAVVESTAGHFALKGLNSDTPLKPEDLQRLLKFVLAQQKLWLSASQITLQLLSYPKTILLSDLQLQLHNWQKLQRYQLDLTLGPTLNFERIELKIDVNGELLPTDPASLEVYLHIQQWNLASDFTQFYTHNTAKSGLITAESWMQIKQGQIGDVLTTFAVSQIQPGVFDADAHKGNHAVNFNGQLLWRPEHKRDNKSWQMRGLIDDLTLDDESFEAINFSLNPSPQEKPGPNSLNLAIDQLQLALVSELAIISGQLASKQVRRLRQAQLSGSLQHLHLSLPRAGNWRAFEFRSQFEQLSLAAVEQVPTIQGLSGYVNFTSKDGWGFIDAKQMAIDGFFRNPVKGLAVQGGFAWQRLAQQFNFSLDRLALKHADFQAQIDMRLEKSAEHIPTISLHVAVANGRVERAGEYVPTFKSSISDYLDKTLTHGTLLQGDVILRGPLADFPFSTSKTGVFQVRTDLEQVNYRYLPDWPELVQMQVEYAMRGQVLSAKLSDGYIAGAHIQSVSATLPSLKAQDLPWLEIEAQLEGNFSHIDHFIKYSPLHQTIGASLSPLDISGPVTVGLSLNLPIKHQQGQKKINGSVNFNGAQVAINAWDIELKEMDGLFQFTGESFNAKDINAQFYGHPITLKVKRKKAGEGISNPIQIAAEGLMSAQAIMSRYPDPLSQGLQGAAPFSLAATLYNDGTTPSTLAINSNLVGLFSDLPAPIGKSKQQVRPFALNVNLNNGTINQLTAKYADLAEIVASFQVKTQLLTPFDLNVELFSNTDLVDWWPRLFGDLSERSDSPFQLQSAKVLSPTIQVNDFIFNDLALQANRLHLSSWQLSIVSDFAKGQIYIPSDLTVQPMDVTWQLLQLQSTQIKAKSGEEYEQQADIMLPQDLPWMNFLCHDCRYQGLPFGEVSAVLKPYSQGVELTDITLHHLDPSQNKKALALLVGTAQGFWEYADGQHRTHLAGKMVSGNIGKLIDTWQRDAGIAEASASLGFNLEWDAPPHQFKAAYLNGKINRFRIRHGRLVEVDTGGGGFINLLSLSRLQHMLALDFSDFQKGFPFKVIKADFDVEAGILSSNNLVIDGPMARIEMNGIVDLNQKIYSYHQQIIPKVTSSLPMLTLLFNPPAAVGVYLIDKLFKPSDKLARFEGELKGGWGESSALSPE